MTFASGPPQGRPTARRHDVLDRMAPLAPLAVPVGRPCESSPSQAPRRSDSCVRCDCSSLNGFRSLRKPVQATPGCPTARRFDADPRGAPPHRATTGPHLVRPSATQPATPPFAPSATQPRSAAYQRPVLPRGASGGVGPRHVGPRPPRSGEENFGASGGGGRASGPVGQAYVPIASRAEPWLATLGVWRRRRRRRGLFE